MKLLIIIALFLTACTTPCICPDQDIYMWAGNEDTGKTALIAIPKGFLNNPDNYINIKEYETEQIRVENKTLSRAIR